MKIIHKGNEKIYTTTCAQCHSDLEYTEDDVYFTTEERRGGLRKTISHVWRPDEHYINVYLQPLRCIKCPVCGHVIKFIDFENGLPYMKTVRWEKIT